MKFTTTLICICIMLSTCRSIFADPETPGVSVSGAGQIVPTAYSGTPGNSTFLGTLSSSQRTYQLLIHANQLAALAGSTIFGINVRLPISATANWPLANVNFSNYDIYLSNCVDPVNRSLTFANNIVGTQVQVRSGPLFIPANSYSFGNTPNALGPVIAFNLPYNYSGGNLLVEIRHTGFTGTSRSADAISTSTPGYSSDFSACWTGNYSGTSGSQGNFTILGLATAGPEPQLSFFQRNYDINGYIEPNSDWGEVHLTTDGFAGLKYFNLSVGATGLTTNWQIQNAILFNQANPGTEQTLTFAFDIGNKGVDVSGISYGYTITDQPLLSPPPITESDPVAEIDYKVYDGFPFFNSNSEGLKIPEAVPFQNTGSIKDTASHGIKNMPNQDCGVNECAPVSFSNSLKYLRREHNLTFDSAYASLDSMKKATGFIDATMTAQNYFEKKAEYLKKNNIPITTRKIETTNVFSIQKELDNEQDVEMFVWWFTIDSVSGDTSTGSHLVNVTNVKKLGGGKYQITAQDDRKQGQAGGTESEPVIYDSASNKFTSGSYTAYNMGIYHFVVECPNKLAAQQLVPPNQSNGVNPGSPLKWTKPPGAASYWLEVATDLDFQNLIINQFSVPDSFYIPSQGELMDKTTYFWRVRVNDSAGPGSYTSVFEFTTGSGKTLFVEAFIQGFYDASSDLMVADTMRIQLREMFPPYNVVDSSKAVINSLGFGNFSFYDVFDGVSYYIVLNHRNSIVTFSSSGVQFTGGLANYSFAFSAAQAYGSNMILVDNTPIRYAIYGGDVNRDDVVDATDLSAIDNDAFNFVNGYVQTDINGDGFVDATDYAIAGNNSDNFVGAILP